jgi:hypothetical protein
MATMKTEAIAPAQLSGALARANRSPSWNFRDEPIRATTVVSCTIHIVPAKLWAHRRRHQQWAPTFPRKQTQ